MPDLAMNTVFRNHREEHLQCEIFLSEIEEAQGQFNINSSPVLSSRYQVAFESGKRLCM